MEFERRKLKRKPLSDFTNTPHRPLTKHPKLPISTLKQNETSANYDTSTGSNKDEHPTLQTLPFSPPRWKSPAILADAHHEDSKRTTVFRQRQTVAKSRDKEKTVSVATAKTKDNGKTVSWEVPVVPLSVPPPRRLRNRGVALEKEDGDINKPEKEQGNGANLNKEERGVVVPDTSTESSDAGNFTFQTQIFTPLQPKLPADDEDQNSEINVAKTKVKGKAVLVDPGITKDKDKAPSFVSFSCPPQRRLQNIWDMLEKVRGDIDKLGKNQEESDERNEEQRGDDLSKRGTLPLPKESQHAMSQDFIDEQRAYFAEVDAFQLLEEVASQSESESESE